MSFASPLENLSGHSKVIILDFEQIPAADLPPEEDIQRFFEESIAAGVNPRSPENRQQFNDRMLAYAGVKYLIGRYREDRSSMLVGSEMYEQGRVIHLGVDIFTEYLEPILAPCDGEVVSVGHETQERGYGYHMTIKPSGVDELFLFMGHLSKRLPTKGNRVQIGQEIARLGDYTDDENGGWSRHLHLQMLTELPPEGQTAIGYSTPGDLAFNVKKFPDPRNYFNDLID